MCQPDSDPNAGFANLSEVLVDSLTAAAILGRLLHQASTGNIKGVSGRFKEKRKAGLLGKSKPRTQP